MHPDCVEQWQQWAYQIVLFGRKYQGSHPTGVHLIYRYSFIFSFNCWNFLRSQDVDSFPPVRHCSGDKPAWKTAINQLQISEIIRGSSLVFRLLFPLKACNDYDTSSATVIRCYVLRGIFPNPFTHHFALWYSAYPKIGKATFRITKRNTVIFHFVSRSCTPNFFINVLLETMHYDFERRPFVSNSRIYFKFCYAYCS